MLFLKESEDYDLFLMPNDLCPSNIIVADDKIMAVVDWEMAGFMGWKTAGDIQVKYPDPKAGKFCETKVIRREVARYSVLD
jgi:hypothetical protein